MLLRTFATAYGKMDQNCIRSKTELQNFGTMINDQSNIYDSVFEIKFRIFDNRLVARLKNSNVFVSF